MLKHLDQFLAHHRHSKSVKIKCCSIQGWLQYLSSSHLSFPGSCPASLMNLFFITLVHSRLSLGQLQITHRLDEVLFSNWYLSAICIASHSFNISPGMGILGCSWTCLLFFLIIKGQGIHNSKPA